MKISFFSSKNDAIAEARGLIGWVLESAICEESAYRIVQEIIFKKHHEPKPCYSETFTVKAYIKTVYSPRHGLKMPSKSVSMHF